MIVELKKGYTIESKYDKFTDSYITRLLDNESKQVGDPLSSKDIVGKNQDIKSIKDYFGNYINNKRVEDEIEDELDFIEPEEKMQSEEITGDDLFEESFKLTEALEVATAYLLRNDGEVFKCEAFHSYLKEGDMTVEQFFNESAFDVTLNSFYDYSNQNYVIRGIEALVNSFVQLYPSFKQEIDTYIKFDYSHGQIFDKIKLEVLYNKLNDLTNQEFCRVRTSSIYGTNGKSQDIYIRISSNGFDWSDIIYNFIMKNKNFVETITIDKDNKSVQQPVIYTHKGQKIDHMTVDDFLSLSGQLMLESQIDTEIEKKARKTKRATRKAKLPALSKLSPIMPDTAKGISNFNTMQADGNSSMGSTTGSISLGEEYKDREMLINELKQMGFKYKFDKYSDKQLFRIYQERQNYLNKWRKEKALKDKAKKEQRMLADQKRENAKDSYFKDGIEFESEDAAREYFGEKMNSKVYLNKLHEAWDIADNLFDEFGDDPESLRIECPNGEDWCVMGHDGNDTYFFGDNKQDCVDWCEDRGERYYFYESLNNKSLNESLALTENHKSKNHNFNTLDEAFRYFESKHFDEQCEDIQLECLYESMRDKLSSDDIKKLGSFMNHAQDADEVLTYMKGLLSKDKQSIKESFESEEPLLVYDFEEYTDGSPYIALYSWDDEYKGWDLYADVTTNIGLNEPDLIVLNHDLSADLQQKVIDDLGSEVLGTVQYGRTSSPKIKLKDNWQQIILDMIEQVQSQISYE